MLKYTGGDPPKNNTKLIRYNGVPAVAKYQSDGSYKVYVNNVYQSTIGKGWHTEGYKDEYGAWRDNKVDDTKKDASGKPLIIQRGIRSERNQNEEANRKKVQQEVNTEWWNKDLNAKPAKSVNNTTLTQQKVSGNKLNIITKTFNPKLSSNIDVSLPKSNGLKIGSSTNTTPVSTVTPVNTNTSTNTVGKPNRLQTPLNPKTVPPVKGNKLSIGPPPEYPVSPMKKKGLSVTKINPTTETHRDITNEDVAKGLKISAPTLFDEYKTMLDKTNRQANLLSLFKAGADIASLSSAINQKPSPDYQTPVLKSPTYISPSQYIKAGQNQDMAESLNLTTRTLAEQGRSDAIPAAQANILSQKNQNTASLITQDIDAANKTNQAATEIANQQASLEAEINNKNIEKHINESLLKGQTITQALNALGSVGDEYVSRMTDTDYRKWIAGIYQKQIDIANKQLIYQQMFGDQNAKLTAGGTPMSSSSTLDTSDLTDTK